MPFLGNSWVHGFQMIFFRASMIGRSMKRNFNPAEPELMDRPQSVTPELESDLRNIRQLNRYFGSYRLIFEPRFTCFSCSPCA